MTPGEAIRRFEQKLVSARTIAATSLAWQHYAADVLPLSVQDDEKKSAPIHQGFEAGYDAAMQAVRGILIAIQNDVLRDTPAEPEEVRMVPVTVNNELVYVLTSAGLRHLGHDQLATEQRERAVARLAARGYPVGASDPAYLWCPLRGTEVPITECAASCPAPEQRVVCAMELETGGRQTVPPYDDYPHPYAEELTLGGSE